MEPLEVVGLAVAAFAAGVINAIAGGGTLITFPGLLGIGYSAKVANMTNTVAVWPGTMSSSWAYRPELSRQRGLIIKLLPFTVVGALAGSALLLYTPASTFRALVPFLILGACAILALQDRLIAMVYRGKDLSEQQHNVPLAQVVVFLTAVYGGYFGAGQGIIMLAIFGLFLPDDIQHSNALKGLMAAVINGLAAGYFAVFGEVAWTAAGIMAVSSLIGGYSGVFVARRLRRDRLRQVAVVYGVIAALVLILR